MLGVPGATENPTGAPPTLGAGEWRPTTLPGREGEECAGRRAEHSPRVGGSAGVLRGCGAAGREADEEGFS